MTEARGIIIGGVPRPRGEGGNGRRGGTPPSRGRQFTRPGQLFAAVAAVLFCALVLATQPATAAAAVTLLFLAVLTFTDRRLLLVALFGLVPFPMSLAGASDLNVSAAD